VLEPLQLDLEHLIVILPIFFWKLRRYIVIEVTQCHWSEASDIFSRTPLTSRSLPHKEAQVISQQTTFVRP